MSDLHELVQALSQEVVLWDTYVATAALLVFDHIITFDQEVERIWKRKRNVASVLFVVNRIGALLFSTTMMWNTFGPAIATSCAVSFELWIAFTLIMQFVIPIFFCLRIWAIWGRHWLPLVVLVPLSCAIMGITIYLDAVQFYWQISFDLPAPFGGCEYATYASFLCATLAKTVKTKREANHAGIKAGLTTLLLRDGSLYAGYRHDRLVNISFPNLLLCYRVIFLFNMIAVILLYVVSEQLGILGSMSQAFVYQFFHPLVWLPKKDYHSQCILYRCQQDDS
ncbi:hypothetical protein C8Q75DRAFT_736555 [Abortiporus biennis]|nr:hypothetical protein C8Q75DRAFT_736555 [Abortiporus biennis]